MWISKKKWDGLQEQLSLLKTQVSQAGGQIAAQTADWSEKLAGMQSAASKHEMAIEDMLDSWEEWQSKLQAQEARQAVKEKCDTAVLQQREKALIRLLTNYHDQFFALGRAAEEAGNEAWSRQFSVSMDKLSESLALAGVQVIDRPGAAFSYALHEAADVIETADQAQDMRVARVYSCGYVYKGNVVRKAKTAIYQYRETQL